MNRGTNRQRVACKYFNGTVHESCDAGINYRILVAGPDEGWIRRTPCLSTHETEIVCLRRQFPTPEEVKEREAALHRRADAMGDAFAAIDAQHKADGKLLGKIECPLCKGELVYTIARCNGHIWGHCRTTEGCLSWMQ